VSIERQSAKGIIPGMPAQPLEENCAKNQQAWQRLYQEHLEPVYRYIYSKVGHREEAEDLTEQTFLKAVHSIDYTRSPQSIQHWLFQVARTTIADYWRLHYRLSIDSLDVLLDAGWEGPIARQDEELPEANPGDYVQKILASLPQHYREVLTCRFLLNLSIKETASTLGLTEANVKVLQFRALNSAANQDRRSSGSSDQRRGE
jgi:RNA polymerase sigma-70 factor (ECF subfamily)